MAVKPKLGFKIWTAALSIFVAALLFPNIVAKHGVARSLFITALAVGAIWGMYFVIGYLIDREVLAELKKRGLSRPEDRPDGRG